MGCDSKICYQRETRTFLQFCLTIILNSWIKLCILAYDCMWRWTLIALDVIRIWKMTIFCPFNGCLHLNVCILFSILNSPKNYIFSLKKWFETQYFTLKNFEKYGNFSVKNILKISPKLRISVLINFVLINKKKSVDLMPPVWLRFYNL